MQVLLVADNGSCRVDSIESIPSLVSKHWRAFMLTVGEDGIPAIGDEFTLGEAQTMSTIFKQDVLLNGEVVGSGQYKA